MDAPALAAPPRTSGAASLPAKLSPFRLGVTCEARSGVSDSHRRCYMGKRGSRVELRRWWPLAVGALGAATGGVMAGRRRAAARRPDPFEDWVTRFRLSHEALRRNLRHFIDLIDRQASMNVDAFGDFVALYAKFLMVHHESEDRIIFPTLRRHGRLRSTDAAHLDKWSTEHHAVNALGEALMRTGRGIRDGER